jgi:Amt family ammonium transporter
MHTAYVLHSSYAERIKWKSAFFLTVMWEIFIFYPVAHWIWGGGWLQKMDVLDFAGGIGTYHHHHHHYHYHSVRSPR